MTPTHTKLSGRLLALSAGLLLLPSACASKGTTPGKPSGGGVLTRTRWNGFDNFLNLAARTYPYVLVSRGGAPLEDGEAYRVAFAANSYTEEVGRGYNVQVKAGSLGAFVRAWLEEQGTVPPDANPRE